MAKQYIICGKFFDGVHQELKENVKILVEDKTIAAVGNNLLKPEDAQIIDLSHLTVTPGLIDSHLHFEFMGFTFNEFSITDSDEMKTLNLVRNCMIALENGYTTLRTTGTAFLGFGCLDAPRAIDCGMFPAARLIVAPHALGIPGGHWDFSTFYCNTNPRLCEFMEQKYALTSGADNFKMLVRKQVKYGADFIKIMATGGFASPNDDPAEPQLDDDELRAIINTSHNLGKKVVVHVYGGDVMMRMIGMGIDEIEHGTLMTEEIADMMEKKNIDYVPTIFSLMGDPHAASITHPRPPAYQRKLAKYAKQLEESRATVVRLIKNEIITIGLGSDIVSNNHNIESWREFQAWRNIGIPALRTLVAATSANAKIVGRSDIGELVPGKLADIAGWRRDVLSDFDALSECSFVMKEGVIYKNL